MPPVVDYVKGKPQVKRVETFCSVLGKHSIPEDKLYSEVLSDIDKLIKTQHPQVKTGALSNCHGDWYEWMLAQQAWNYRVENNKNIILLLLPNVTSFDVAELYQDNLYDYICDLRQKVGESANVKLITSNPDFVLIDTNGIELTPEFSQIIDEFTPEAISFLEKSYTNFIRKCSFTDIVGYLSVKTTFRPDRRLQLSHEGSLMKALYAHLQTRDWIINPKGLKYYGASTSISEADRKGLRTVATHSIINVQSMPQAAVDEVFQINSNISAREAFEVILSE
tara:strand:+ start:1667 stop:2506 length:840 start_codon:yes stop_codon:yes gene_type:complete